MPDKLSRNIIFKLDETQGSQLSSFAVALSEYIQKLSNVSDKKKVYNLLVNQLVQRFALLNCSVYEIDKAKKVKEVLLLDASSTNILRKESLLESPFGKTLLEKTFSTRSTGLISDIGKEGGYIPRDKGAKSVVVKSFSFQEKILAVFVLESGVEGFFNEAICRLIETFLFSASLVLSEIDEKEALKNQQKEIENALLAKETELTNVLNKLTEQSINLEGHKEKQQILIQEVHHRVVNNLQVISSILRLFMSKPPENSGETLEQIHNRVQAIALIHQNLYKSLEMDLVSINYYLYDLINYLKGTSKNIHVTSNFKLDRNYLSIESLVPIGLFFVEVFYFCLERAQSNAIDSVSLDISLNHLMDQSMYEIIIKDAESIKLKEEINIESTKELNHVLISALIDQIEGELSQGFDNGNYIKLRFKSN